MDLATLAGLFNSFGPIVGTCMILAYFAGRWIKSKVSPPATPAPAVPTVTPADPLQPAPDATGPFPRLQQLLDLVFQSRGQPAGTVNAQSLRVDHALSLLHLKDEINAATQPVVALLARVQAEHAPVTSASPPKPTSP